MTITWNALNDPDVVGYKVLAATTSGGHDSSVWSADVPVGTETVTCTLEENGTYYFIVIAYDAQDRETDPSNECSVTIDEGLPPVTGVQCN